MSDLRFGPLSRRALVGGGAALLLCGAGRPSADPAGRLLLALEKRAGIRVGLAAIDTGNGRAIFYREAERFLMCSTFKASLVAAVLSRVDAGREDLSRLVRYGKSDLLSYAPVTEKHVATGMTVEGLCAAALTLSDNTAANLLLATIGGPEGLTRYWRSLGDETSRLDRREPDLNRPDGMKDTTTPSAMLGTLKTILLGNALSPASRKRLADWLAACATGGAMLRAGLPKDWAVGDKTGHGDAATNDIAIATPPGRKPILIVAFTAGPDTQPVAEMGRIVAETLR